MSAVTETPIQKTMPDGNRVAPTLAARPASPPPTDRHQVMDTLLGENRLIAVDVSGGDPYNATGRLFRR